jgi:hypothetical protein
MVISIYILNLTLYLHSIPHKQFIPILSKALNLVIFNLKDSNQTPSCKNTINTNLKKSYLPPLL